MRKQTALLLPAIALAVVSVSGCFMYHKQYRVLIDGISIDQTLDVAKIEMAKNEFGTVLTVWAVRDQIFTGPQAARVSELYFQHIERIDSEAQKARVFSVWHLTWAISNIYRLGNEAVKVALREAHKDAEHRVKVLDKRIATKMFHEEKIYMGDAHLGGRAYARKHLVVPGDQRFLQSAAELED